MLTLLGTSEMVFELFEPNFIHRHRTSLYSVLYVCCTMTYNVYERNFATIGNIKYGGICHFHFSLTRIPSGGGESIGPPTRFCHGRTET